MKPLSERLEEERDRISYRKYMGKDRFVNFYVNCENARSLMSEAIQLAKSVESAPVGAFEDVANTVSYVGWIDTMPGRELPLALRDSLNGQRVALVPLPQQSES